MAQSPKKFSYKKQKVSKLLAITCLCGLLFGACFGTGRVIPLHRQQSFAFCDLPKPCRDFVIIPNNSLKVFLQLFRKCYTTCFIGKDDDANVA